MNNKKTIQRLKIFASLFLALVLVSYGSPYVFVAGSTQIKPEFIAQIQSSPLRFLGFIQKPTGSGTKDSEETELMNSYEDKKSLDYKPIRKGVYAAEDPVTKERFVKIDKGTKLEKRYVTVDGQEVMIYVPVE